MSRLTEALMPDKLLEVSCSCLYVIDGKVVNRMLKFFVKEEQFKQQYNNAADLGMR